MSEPVSLGCCESDVCLICLFVNLKVSAMETDNKTSGGRLLVEESSSDVQNDRIRFEIELKHGETTIVSWLQLLEDSGISLDQSPEPKPEPEPEPESETETEPVTPKRLHQEDESRSECSNIILKKEDEQNCRPKKQRTAISERMNITKNTKMGHARVKSITVKNHIGDEHSVNNGRLELPDLNVPYTVQAVSTLSRLIKEESCGMVDGLMLESTILEMETMVADSRRVHDDAQDAHHMVATKSRLPREIKQKLETVARLAHSSQGRISDELIKRLMSILGHWLKPRTLKRCLRDMVPCDLSACGGDAVRISQIRTEVIEMIKLRNPSKNASHDETMDLHVAHKTKYSMDHEMEDKICDFYDIYVQGMDEAKSSEIRKFYIQLAALWPNGTMDNHGIRNAICRSKERRRTALQEKGHEKGKRKKSSTAGLGLGLGLDEDLHEEAKRPANDTNAPVLTFAVDTVVPGTPELDQNLSAPAKRSCQDLFKQRKFNFLKETT